MSGSETDRSQNGSCPMALIVEDDLLCFEMLSAMIKAVSRLQPMHLQLDIDVIGQHLSQAAPSDVLFLDIILTPKFDGFDVGKLVAASGFPGRVVLMSSFAPHYLSMLQRLLAAKGIQVTGTLHKPIDPDELAAALAA